MDKTPNDLWANDPGAEELYFDSIDRLEDMGGEMVLFDYRPWEDAARNFTEERLFRMMVRFMRPKTANMRNAVGSRCFPCHWRITIFVVAMTGM